MVEKNTSEALEWSEKVWKTDEPLGHYNKGAFLSGPESTWGVKPDTVKSKLAYKNARVAMENKLSKNDPHYLFSLGRIIYHGEDGSDSDHKQGCTYLQQAAELEHPLAQDQFADCLYYGRGRDKDLTGAAKWYERAAESGIAGSAWTLGELYQKEDGVKALHYFERAVELNTDTYALKLGRMLENGVITQSDPLRAFKNYKLAANKGNVRAKYRMALLHNWLERYCS